MRSVRFVVAIFAPVVVVACAVGTAPEGGGGAGDGDAGTTVAGDSGYGTGDSGPVSSNDSGVKTEAGTREGGAPPIDGGTVLPPTSGSDCSGKTSTSGASYESECKDLANDGDESDCTAGGGECGTGTCCWDNPGSFSLGSCDGFFGDFLSAQCVAQ